MAYSQLDQVNNVYGCICTFIIPKVAKLGKIIDRSDLTFQAWWCWYNVFTLLIKQVIRYIVSEVQFLQVVQFYIGVQLTGEEKGKSSEERAEDSPALFWKLEKCPNFWGNSALIVLTYGSNFGENLQNLSV